MTIDAATHTKVMMKPMGCTNCLALDLLYWGVVNPAPGFNGDVLPGDNLFTNSILALHAH